MCGGGGDRKARKEAKRRAKQAERDARRREREAVRRAEQQAQRMLEQQERSYKAMQAMIPKPPPKPVNKPASTTVETAPPEPTKTYIDPKAGKVGFGSDMDGGIKLRKESKKKKRGRSSLLIGLNPGVRGAGSGPNIG